MCLLKCLSVCVYVCVLVGGLSEGAGVIVSVGDG